MSSANYAHKVEVITIITLGLLETAMDKVIDILKDNTYILISKIYI